MRLFILISVLLLAQGAFAQEIRLFDELPEIHKRLLINEVGHKKMQPITFDRFAVDGNMLEAEEIGEDVYYYYGAREIQIISKNDQLGNELIKRSNVKKNPVEYLTVSAVYQGKEYHFNDFYTSKSIDGIDLSKIDVAFEIFMTKFKKKTGHSRPDYITFAHSHPVYEAVTSDGKTITRKSLSTQDMFLAKNVSRLLKIPVMAKAVLPNGYSYSAIFQNGINSTGK